MDKEALQRQVEDLEAASERWRAERRRLNAEIDKLEAALADAKAAAARKRDAPASSPQADAAAVLKAQKAADEKLQKLVDEWEGERDKLRSQVHRLEGSLAEAIARASNPLRMTQSVKEQFEFELNRVARDKTDLEQAFLRAKTEWEQEKLKMTGDLVKLRRNAEIMGRPVGKANAPEANPKVRDIENQLKEKLDQWGAEREGYVAQIRKLEEGSRQWEAERRQLNDHAAHLQQSLVKADAKIQSQEVAARKPNPFQRQVHELTEEKEGLQRELEAERSVWEEERGRSSEKIQQLEQQLKRVSETKTGPSNEVVDQLRQQYEQKLQEAIQQKSQLSNELQKASEQLEAERKRLSAAQQTTGASTAGMDTAAIQTEVARVQKLVNEIAAIIDNPETELSTIIKKNVEKAELDSYLKGILFALGKK